jgi:hypothetical protein
VTLAHSLRYQYRVADVASSLEDDDTDTGTVDDEGQTMTEWVVERMPRTANPAPSGSPTGGSALMPPHSQGAERRTERRAGRWGLRVLVIGGLAGAAWLLTGAAAHAADRDPASGGSLLGSSPIGSVVNGDTTHLAVPRILQAVARPLESDGTDRQHLGIVREITGPLRLTGGPADSPVRVRLTQTPRLASGTGPAPLQMHLGVVSGIPTTGSGAPTGGGSAAFLPAAVAAGTMAFHRQPPATDVEVRRHDAETPTVSPD